MQQVFVVIFWSYMPVKAKYHSNPQISSHEKFDKNIYYNYSSHPSSTWFFVKIFLVLNKWSHDKENGFRSELTKHNHTIKHSNPRNKSSHLFGTKSMRLVSVHRVTTGLEAILLSISSSFKLNSFCYQGWTSLVHWLHWKLKMSCVSSYST